MHPSELRHYVSQVVSQFSLSFCIFTGVRLSRSFRLDLLADFSDFSLGNPKAQKNANIVDVDKCLTDAPTRRRR